ncbi:hypothetical protein MP638_000042 [Amoeboaphelidium occidentale]|nr:hypothetical protein MP638_000042 [Amoeboaphelidium occidentale]
MKTWRKVNLRGPKELNLARTLNSGQSFRWYKTSYGWTSAFSGFEDVLISLKQDDTDFSSFQYFIHPIEAEQEIHTVEPKETEMESALHNYFQLEVNLEQLYKEWTQKDENFAAKSKLMEGIRVLRVDPTECLVSFICSSCNNIPRIRQMVQNMSSKFGVHLGEVDGHQFYSFPTLKSLCGQEDSLRELGFGYRAKYISVTATMILERASSENTTPELYLAKLRDASYEECKSVLTGFPGIGSKVADCISLISLNKHAAIPVDTHVRQIAERDYKYKTKMKSVTDKVYLEIQQVFTSLFGEYAGWAQSVLFTSDLTWDFDKTKDGIDINEKEQEKENRGNEEEEGNKKSKKKRKLK